MLCYATSFLNLKNRHTENFLKNIYIYKVVLFMNIIDKDKNGKIDMYERINEEMNKYINE